MIKIGLDVRIVMVKNRKQVECEDFWDTCLTGWKRNEHDIISYDDPCEVYYARKFWDLYSPMARRLNIDNGEYSAPLTKDDIEEMIYIATHHKDYFDSFDSVPALCIILDRYDEATKHGMVFLFEGDY